MIVGKKRNLLWRSRFFNKNNCLFKMYLPKFEFCTDNAAMIGITGYYKFLKGEFVTQEIAPVARWNV